ncbi:hypothetical protein Tco_1135801 [Tanacetum coccineum]
MDGADSVVAGGRNGLCSEGRLMMDVTEYQLERWLQYVVKKIINTVSWFGFSMLVTEPDIQTSSVVDHQDLPGVQGHIECL